VSSRKSSRTATHIAAIRRALVVGVVVALTGMSLAPASQAAGTYQIPSSIASDCSSDVTQPILSWIASVPDNSMLSFGSAACYRIDGIVEFTNRNGLVFEGNGATFRAVAVGDGQRPHWRAIGGSNLVIRNMTIQGVHPNPGTRVDAYQWQHGVDLRSVAGVEVDRVNVVNPYGDCFYVGRAWEVSSPWTSDAYIHDSSCTGAGRQGVSVTAGRNITVERVNLRQIALNVFDIEPNGAGFGATNVTLRNNQVSGPYSNSFLAAIGSGPIDGVTVTGNTLSGKGMYMAFIPPVGQRQKNVTIMGNSSDTGYYAPGSVSMYFTRVDGLTVSGNNIPLSGGNMALASASESCNVSVSGNSFPGGVTEARIAPYLCTIEPPPPSLPTLSVANASVNEADSASVSASFAVTLSAAQSSPVTVGFSTANGSAVAPDDYTAQTGAVTFAAGETQKQIVVAVKGDTVDEPNETFAVNLQGPVGATLLDGQAVGTILDNDPAPAPVIPPPPPPANAAPAVDLTAPVAGAVFSSSLSMTANASDDNRVARVEFWANGTRVASDGTAPYSYTWVPQGKKFPYGQYTITAKAFDDAGLSASDSAVVTRLTGTSTSLKVGGGATASSMRGSDGQLLSGHVRGARSGRVVIRLERLDQATGKWVHAKTRKLRLGRRGKFATRLSRLENGRWRAKAKFRGTRNRAPSESRYGYFVAG
jgi:hypothetical protein